LGILCCWLLSKAVSQQARQWWRLGFGSN
jgi:hypothetical protein